MPTFNVLNDAWIPVEDMQGNIKEYGIIEMLENAHKLRGISDSSPLFEYGMYRLVIAFLTDALRPKSIDDLLNIYHIRQLPIERIIHYINDCKKDGECFDLFDKKKPFLQSAWNDELDKKAVRSTALRIHDLPSGHNSIHYDHRLQEEQILCPEICARALCTVNVFCTVGGFQIPSGINGAPPWYMIICGKNLFETLVFNIFIPNGELSFDNPPIAWRNHKTIIPGNPVKTSSYLYGLTWQSRRICLIPEEILGYCSYSGRKSSILVKKMAFQKGWRFEGYGEWRDPYSPQQSNGSSMSSIKPKETWVLWGDFEPLTLLYGIANGKYTRFKPEIIGQYENFYDKLDNPTGVIDVKTYGLVTEQAKYISWLRNKLKIFIKTSINEDIAQLITNELSNIEKVSFIIKSFLSKLTTSSIVINNIRSYYSNSIRMAFYCYLQQPVIEAATQKKSWNIKVIRRWHNELTIIAVETFEYSLNMLGDSFVLMEKAFKAKKYFYSELSKLNVKGLNICNKG